MDLQFIGNMVDEGILTSPSARILEISVYGALIAVLAYFQQCLSTGEFTSRQVPLGIFVSTLLAGCLSGYSALLRNKKEEKEKLLNDLNIAPKPDAIV